MPVNGSGIRYTARILGISKDDVIAYVLGYRKLKSLERLTALISDLNLNISCVYTDNNLLYHEVINHGILRIGKRNTQKIERKYLTFWSRLKRLARKTVCYSKSFEIHTILFGLLINLTEFSIDKQTLLGYDPNFLVLLTRIIFKGIIPNIIMFCIFLR